jgi:hypothetical protein
LSKGIDTILTEYGFSNSKIKEKLINGHSSKYSIKRYAGVAQFELLEKVPDFHDVSSGI